MNQIEAPTITISGMAGSGKTTLAKIIENALSNEGIKSHTISSDVIDLTEMENDVDQETWARCINSFKDKNISIKLQIIQLRRSLIS